MDLSTQTPAEIDTVWFPLMQKTARATDQVLSYRAAREKAIADARPYRARDDVRSAQRSLAHWDSANPGFAPTVES